jgi:tetratricopeptide (TPR) repeat protein
MNDLLSGLLGALLATNQPVALSNLVQQKTGLALQIPDRNDPVEREFRQLMEADDVAQAEVDKWITDNQKFAEKGAGVESITLQARIRDRLALVKNGYEEFFRRHPNHGRARIAYASFLSDTGEEDAALEHLEKARELEPNNPAVWNQLANWHGHNSPVTKSFEYYQKAIDLAPTESTYYWNFATTVFLFRRDATNFFRISEQEVFEKAMRLYHKALELDPDNFALATDVAQTYYGIKLFKTGDSEADERTKQKHYDDALAAWQKAFGLAGDDVERQGILIHYARLQINAGRFDAAQTNLNAITNNMLSAVKVRLQKKLDSERAKAGAPATANKP